MRRGLRYTLVASSLAVAAFVPASAAFAASTTPGAGPGSALCTGDQQRLHLQDGTGLASPDRLQLRDRTCDQTCDQDRLQLRDGTGGGFVRAGAPGFAYSVHHASGACAGTHIGLRVLDGTGSQWHWMR